MKPVMQTRVGEEGNCLSACIASLLEVPIEEIDLSCALNPDTWFEQLNAKLKPFGVMLFDLGVRHDGQGNLFVSLVPDQHFIAMGPTNQHPTRHHAVIWKQVGESRLVPVHDPHPDRIGLLDVVRVALLLPRHGVESLAELAQRRPRPKKSTHIAMSTSAEVGKTDAYVERQILPGLLVEGRRPTVAEFRKMSAEARAAGFEVFPPCSEHDAKGYCKGHPEPAAPVVSVEEDPIVDDFTGQRRSDAEREQREREAMPPGQLRKGITYTSCC